MAELSIVGFCPRSRRFGIGAVSDRPGGFGDRLAVQAWRGLVYCHGGPAHRSVRRAEQHLAQGWRGAALLDALRSPAAAEDGGAGEDAERLLLTIDAQGRIAASTGAAVQRSSYFRDGSGRAAASTGVASASAVVAMLKAFDDGHDDDMAERLLRSLEAGATAADQPGSSAFLRVHDPSIEYAFTDVTVDLHEAPVAALRRAHDWLSPLYGYYAQRGQDPTIARYPQWLTQQGIKR